MPQVASQNGKTVLFALQPPSTIKVVLLYEAASTWTRVDNVTQLSAVAAGGTGDEADFVCYSNTSDGGVSAVESFSRPNQFSIERGDSIPYSENVLTIASSAFPEQLFLQQASSVKYYAPGAPSWAPVEPLATVSDPNALVIGPIAASNCGLAYVVQGGDIMFWSGDPWEITPHPDLVANLGALPGSLVLSPPVDGAIDGGALLVAATAGLIGVYSVPCP
jgi:hypothetical protein